MNAPIIPNRTQARDRSLLGEAAAGSRASSHFSNATSTLTARVRVSKTGE
jgi:hypothetical protein